MICLNPIMKSPALAAFVGGCAVLFYFALMTYSPNLPAAVFCSMGVAYIVYNLMGGKLMCDEPATVIEEPSPPPQKQPPKQEIPVAANALTYRI